MNKVTALGLCSVTGVAMLACLTIFHWPSWVTISLGASIGVVIGSLVKL